MKRRVILAFALLAFFGLAFNGTCSSPADQVAENLGKECEKFNCQRRIIAVNGITDKVLFEVEGRCSIEKNKELEDTLTVTCKQGPDDYKKHFIGIPDNVTFVSTQLQGLDVSEYRTKIIFKPEGIVPDIDLLAGETP